MLDVVCFKWSPRPGYRSTYTAEHVNTLGSMIRAKYPHPHRFSCITDDPAGLDRKVRPIPLWDTYRDLPSPHGGNNPSCFRRLKLWSTWARENIGARILSIDLDMVLTADVSGLWNRPEDVVLWADNLNPTTPYNGAMQLIRAGTRPEVWDTFTPDAAMTEPKRYGYFGSDQAWISYVLGPGEARWTTADGAYSWRVHCRQTPKGQAHLKWAKERGCGSDLPKGAKVVNFHGADDPWTLAPHVPWIAEHYR